LRFQTLSGNVMPRNPRTPPYLSIGIFREARSKQIPEQMVKIPETGINFVPSSANQAPRAVQWKSGHSRPRYRGFDCRCGLQPATDPKGPIPRETRVRGSELALERKSKGAVLPQRCACVFLVLKDWIISQAEGPFAFALKLAVAKSGIGSELLLQATDSRDKVLRN